MVMAQARQLRKQQAEAAAHLPAVEPSSTGPDPSILAHGSNPAPQGSVTTGNGQAHESSEAAALQTAGSESTSSSGSEDGSPQPRQPVADTQQRLPPSQPSPASPSKPKAPVIKLKLSGASLPSRAHAASAQPQAAPAVRIEVAKAAATQPQPAQSSSSDASISDSDAEAAALQAKAAAKKKAPRCVHDLLPIPHNFHILLRISRHSQPLLHMHDLDSMRPNMADTGQQAVSNYSRL